MKKISDTQISQLYKFTRSHYVEWYDLQTELVDHLANGIEMQWVEEPNLAFESALNHEFKKFGIYGFSDLIEQKSLALSKYYRKEIYRYFKDFFRLPKIIITGFAIWALHLFSSLFEQKLYIIIPFIILICITHSVHAFKEKKAVKVKFNKTGKKWFVDLQFVQLGGLIHVLNIGLWFPGLTDPNRQWTNISELILITCLVLYALLFYIAIKIVTPKLKQKVSNEYPEYNLN